MIILKIHVTLPQKSGIYPKFPMLDDDPRIEYNFLCRYIPVILKSTIHLIVIMTSWVDFKISRQKQKWYSIIWYYYKLWALESKDKFMFVMYITVHGDIICDWILENHPYGCKWLNKYLALKSSNQFYISTHLWVQ